MGKPKTPEYPKIQPASVITGQDATKQAMDLANQYFGPQMGAQAQGLADLGMGNAYYEQYQPTSFEQALANQQFQNIWPDEQALIMNQLSKSGMAYSPVAAATLGKAYGNLASGIGEYLNTQANTRATNNLTALLGFDPNAYYGPISNAITGQSNQQATLTQNANMQNADAQYKNDLSRYAQNQSGMGALGTVGGAALGALLAAPTGGMSLGMGALLGSGIGNAVLGGGNAGGSLGNYLLASQYLQPQGQQAQSGTGSNGVDMVGNSMSQGYGQNMGGLNNVESVYSLPKNPFA